VLFDLLVNNADRKGSHILVQKRTRKVYLIDHGLCFHVEDKLRTVIWDFAGERIPAEYISSLRKMVKPPTALLNELQRFLNLDELAALELRAELLVHGGCFPQQPADRRAFPYPPL